MPLGRSLLRLLRRPPGEPSRWRPRRRARTGPAPAGYPGDFTGTVQPLYSPNPNGAADPGEIVWTWVPFEEDHTQGKDRPVLIVGKDGPWLLGLMLTTRDHDTRPGKPGEQWIDIGSGSWDRARRPSEIRVDRIIRVNPSSVRREGSVLDYARFTTVLGSLPTSHG